VGTLILFIIIFSIIKIWTRPWIRMGLPVEILEMSALAVAAAVVVSPKVPNGPDKR
jgi:hypothetical protein